MVNYVLNHKSHVSISRNYTIILSSLNNDILMNYNESELKNNHSLRLIDSYFNKILICLLDLFDARQDAEARCNIV